MSLNDFDQGDVRRTIVSMYSLKKVLPTLDNIRTELKQSIGYTSSKGRLRKDLLHTKSAYTRCGVNQKVLMERQDVVLSMIRYLRIIRELREVGYTDETYVHSSYAVPKCWQDSTTGLKIPFPSINKYILEEWQTSWSNSIGNKLLDIKPTIGEYQSVVRNVRREEVVLARLRLVHTRVTHSYLLQGEEPPQCVGCDAPFTVRHFLLECGDFAQVRNNCFHVDNMKELFQDIHIDSIMTFLRQINLFNKI